MVVKLSGLKLFKFSSKKCKFSWLENEINIFVLELRLELSFFIVTSHWKIANFVEIQNESFHRQRHSESISLKF